jgi:hypothetical protein
MKKENHSEEIRATRVGGFGGSDAAIVLVMAERIREGQPLTTAQKHRILQLKGLETRPDFDSPEIQAGRAFEDEVAKSLEAIGWDRETLLQPNPNTTMAIRQHFRVFAHADFYNPKTNTVTECKWSRKFSHEGLEKQYQAQLQWYYMLGADAVCLCSDTSDGRKTTDVARDAVTVETLTNALETIDEAFPALDLTINEKGINELPPTVSALVSEIEAITKTMAKEEEALKAKKAELLDYMDGNDLTKVWSNTASISYTEPSSYVGFDSKKFEKDHADLYAAYRTKLTKKAGYLTVKINKEEK